jgi:hypothetical protein
VVTTDAHHTGELGTTGRWQNRVLCALGLADTAVANSDPLALEKLLGAPLAPTDSEDDD